MDPLADIDLEALRPALAGGAAPKILHAARQDLEVLWPVFGPLAPVFDTQIAAALAGLPAQIGYSDLVRRLLGVELPKGQTRTDWSKRPLSDAQLHYAIDDVIHLAPLRELLLEQLDQLGRLDWLEEDLAGLARAERLFIDPDKAHERLRWSTELDPDRARLLQRLAAWRERRAVDKNRPRSWILEDAALRALVIKPPRSAAELAAITELAPGFIERSGAKILQEIAAAELPAQLPPLPPTAAPGSGAAGTVRATVGHRAEARDRTGPGRRDSGNPQGSGKHRARRARMRTCCRAGAAPWWARSCWPLDSRARYFFLRAAFFFLTGFFCGRLLLHGLPGRAFFLRTPSSCAAFFAWACLAASSCAAFFLAAFFFAALRDRRCAAATGDVSTPTSSSVIASTSPLAR